jgi:hypothetical protein
MWHQPEKAAIWEEKLKALKEELQTGSGDESS